MACAVIVYLVGGFLLSVVGLGMIDEFWEMKRWLRIVVRIVFTIVWLPACVVGVVVWIVVVGIKLFFQ